MDRNRRAPDKASHGDLLLIPCARCGRKVDYRSAVKFSSSEWSGFAHAEPCEVKDWHDERRAEAAR